MYKKFETAILQIFVFLKATQSCLNVYFPPNMGFWDKIGWTLQLHGIGKNWYQSWRVVWFSYQFKIKQWCFFIMNIFFCTVPTRWLVHLTLWYMTQYQLTFFSWIHPKSKCGIWIYTINVTICHIQIWDVSTETLTTGH